MWCRRRVEARCATAIVAALAAAAIVQANAEQTLHIDPYAGFTTTRENEDGFGKVHQEGDHNVHVARVDSHSLTLDPAFNLDFNTAFTSGPARPHGLAMK